MWLTVYRAVYFFFSRWEYVPIEVAPMNLGSAAAYTCVTHTSTDTLQALSESIDAAYVSWRCCSLFNTVNTGFSPLVASALSGLHRVAAAHSAAVTSLEVTLSSLTCCVIMLLHCLFTFSYLYI